MAEETKTIVSSPKDYWISPNALSISLNALGEHDRIQASVASGAVIFCYIKDIAAFDFDAGHNFRKWPLVISPTYFNSTTEKYLYVAIPRSNTIGSEAMIAFPSQLLDIYGRAAVKRIVRDEQGNMLDPDGNITTDESKADYYYIAGDQVGSEDYYYIWLHGIITASGDNSANEREWAFDPKYDTGRLNTDETWGEVVTLEDLMIALQAKVNTDWFSRLFILHGYKMSVVYKTDPETGEPLIDEETGEPIVDIDEETGLPKTVKEDVVIQPNAWPQDGDGITITDIESKYGLWTNFFLSALGKNDAGGGGGGASMLFDLLDVQIPENPTQENDGQALVFDFALGKWTNKTVGGGGGASLNEPLLSINNSGLGLPPQGLTGKVGIVWNYTTQQYEWGEAGGGGGGEGSVTSIGLTAPTGFTVTGSPITSSGTLGLAFADGYSLPTTAKQGQWDEAYNLRHSHSNKGVLDGITAEKVSAWDGVAAIMASPDSDTIINKWQEVVDFLDTYTEADTLAGLLSNKLDVSVANSDFLKKTDAANTYVTKTYFESLFELWNDNTNPSSKIAVNTDISSFTAAQKAKLNIKAMFGFWTEQYISALGKNDDGGGSGGGLDPDAMWELLTTYDGDASHIINSHYLNLSNYALASHNHDGIYSPTGHNHDAVYAKINTVYTKSETDTLLANKLDVAFFNALFQAYAGDTFVSPNTSTSNVDNIKAMFGFWTAQYISALGKNDDQSVVVGSLKDLSDVDPNLNPSGGQVLKYDSTRQLWVAATDQGISTIDWNNITNKPSTFPPSAHNHDDRYYISNGIITIGANSIKPLTSFTESDPTVPSWAKQPTKPSYSFSEIDGRATAQQIPNIEDITNFSTRVYDATATRTANTVLAAPNGSDGAATFRILAEADIPTLSISKISGLQTAIDSKLDKSFFEELFELHSGSTNNPKIDANSDLSGYNKEKFNIKAMFGFWTERYLSALGNNNDGGSVALNALLESLNNSGLAAHGATNTTVVWDGSQWIFGTTGLDQTALVTYLSSKILTLKNGDTTIGSWNPTAPGEIDFANTLSGFITQATADSRYVTELDTSGNYLTWKKNGLANNLTVPYATNADTLDGSHLSDLFAALTSTSSVNLSATIGGEPKSINELYATYLGGLPKTSFPILGITGCTKLASGNDLDSITDNGTWYSENATTSGGISNTPHTSSNFKMVNMYCGKTDYALQWVFAYNSGMIYVRGRKSSTWYDWHTVAFTDSSVASAAKLATERFLWGNRFDGTADVGTANSNASLSYVGNISMNGNISGCTNIDGLLYFDTTHHYLGVDASSPEVKLDVSGDARVTNKLYLYKDASDSTKDVYLEYVSANGGIHLAGGGLYADTYISALGLSDDGSEVFDEDAMWRALATVGSNHKIDNSHLSLGTLTLKDSSENTIGQWTPTGDSVITINAGLDTTAGDARYVKLEGAQTISGTKTFSVQQAFTAAQGTSPFTVNSTTKVANLNAEMLDGLTKSAFPILDVTGCTALASGNDLNNIKTYGSYYSSSSNISNNITNNPHKTSNMKMLNMYCGNTNYALQFVFAYNRGMIYVRSRNNDTWYDWHTVAFTDSSVASAAKLATERFLWGNRFDGTADVGTANSNASLSYVGSISMNGNISGCTNIDGLLYFDTTNSRIGVGTSTPAVGLDVSGDARVTNKLYLYKDASDSTKDVYLEYVSANGGIHLAGGGLYADTYISALGLNDDSSAAFDETAMWIALGTTISQKKINSNYLSLGTLTLNDSGGNLIDTWTPTVSKSITVNTYTHPTNGANTTITTASGKVLSAITVNNLGHVTFVDSKTLAVADIPDLGGTYVTLTTNQTISGVKTFTPQQNFTNGIKIGQYEIVAENGGLHVKGGLYADTFLSALGLSDDGSTDTTTLYDLLDVNIPQTMTQANDGQALVYSYSQGKWVNGSAGMDVNALTAYLSSKTLTLKNGNTTIGTSWNPTAAGTIDISSALSGFVTLTGAQTISGVKTFSVQQNFTVAQGTSPFTVNSTTKVANLNADLLDDLTSGDFLNRYTSSKSLSSAGWYRVAQIDSYGATILLSLGATFTNGVQVAHSLMLNIGYYSSSAKQLSRGVNGSNGSPASGHISNVRLVKFDTGKYYVDVYYLLNKANTEYISIGWLSRFTTTQITMIDWTPVASLASGETESWNEEISYNFKADALQKTISLWGQNFDGTSDIDGNMTVNGTIGTSGDITITKTGTTVSRFVAANGSGTIDLRAAGTNRGVYDTTGSAWLIATNGTNSFLSQGNVGIGTTSPNVKLDVSGDTRVTGKIYLYKPNASNDTGAVYLKYDTNNGGIHLVGGGLYADTYISALGLNDDSSAAFDVTAMWQALATIDSSHKIDNSHLSLGLLTLKDGSNNTLGTWTPTADGIITVNTYTHPTNGANTTITAANKKVLSAITVNNLGHVTSVSSKTLTSIDIPDISADYATSGRVSTLEGFFTNGVAKNADKLDDIDSTGFGRLFTHDLSNNSSVRITFDAAHSAVIFGRSSAGYNHRIVLIGNGYSSREHWKCVDIGGNVTWAVSTTSHSVEIKYTNSTTSKLYISVLAARGTVTFTSISDLSGTAVTDCMAMLTDNVASATKLETARTLWGRSFDGTANVSGNLDSVGNISMNGNISGCTNVDGLLYFDTTNSRVGIGTASPSYKLHVAGSVFGNSLHANNNLSSVAGGSIEGFHSIELNSLGSLVGNYGGFIDFHYTGSSASVDYTSRIIEDSVGGLTVMAKTTSGSDKAAGMRIGTTNGANYLQVGTTNTNSTNQSYMQIGNIRLVYDYSNNALKVQTSTGGAANFYALGGISALGINSNTSGEVSGNLLPSPTNSLTIGDSTHRWKSIYLGDTGITASIEALQGSSLSFSSSTDFYFNNDTEIGGDLYVNDHLGVGDNPDDSYALYVYGTSYLTSRLCVGGTSSSYMLYVNGTSNLNGNVYVKGTLTHSSDMRMKDFVENTEIDVEAIARAPLFKFTWRDRTIDLLTHIGTSAQYWQGVAAETVTADGMGTLGLDYGVTALASVISVARTVMTHEEEIAALKKRVGELEEEVELLKAA